MADSSSRQPLYPIKLIAPKSGAEKKVSGGGRKVPLRSVTTEFRESLGVQVSAAKEALASTLQQLETAPLRVKLFKKALAKSHRPESLFSESSCPIIGAGDLGELFVRASESGLAKLDSVIADGFSPAIVKELSVVDAIEPITPGFRKRFRTPAEILEAAPRGKKGFLTRVQLFNFGGADFQGEHVAAFKSLCKERGLSIREGGYSTSSFTFQVECSSIEDVDAIADSVSVRTITHMPIVQIAPSMLHGEDALPDDLPFPKDKGSDFPVVGIVDSGIREDLADLENWVIGRESRVPPAYRNPEHGTFVAGLVVWGGQFNPDLPAISPEPVGVFDLQVVPNSDAKLGNIDYITEQSLLEYLEDALRQHGNRIRVWNLSLNAKEPCSLDRFSPLAVKLDELQETYKVTFVISAGNFQVPPLMSFPPTEEEAERGRIASPADSVLGVTVGSISHVGFSKRGPKENEPSPFSRVGPGPNFVIKPDLVHYGGTCQIDLQGASGIRSLKGNSLGTDIGTSFAAPLVSRSLAQIYHLVNPTPSPVLARALLTHHAVDPRSRGRIPDRQENYFGFGLPQPPPYCLECSQNSVTLIFEDALRPGYYLEWLDFPYPPSLKRNGKYYGQVAMTIAFAPSRGDKWGSEYCETHIEANFGVHKEVKKRDSGLVEMKFKGLVPPEHKNKGQLYEDYQVQNLRKWSPVRTYFADLAKGEKGSNWRLKLQLLNRHEDPEPEERRSQPFAMIITISDPDGKAPVYDEVSRMLRNRYEVSNLIVRSATRIQARG